MDSTRGIVIRLDPRSLSNPDADLRYKIPDRLAERSQHAISDDGYDYGPGDSPLMFIYLTADELDQAVAQVMELVTTERLCGNDLTRGAVVAVHDEDGWRVVYPPGFVGDFIVPDDGL